MDSSRIDTVIKEFDSLKLEEKEMAFDIINKAFAEANRKKLRSNSKKAIKDYKKGNVKKGDLQDLYKDLEDDSFSLE